MTERKELRLELDQNKAQEVMDDIYEVFKKHDLSAQEGMGCLSFTAAFTILSHMGANTFEDNMKEFVRITTIMFNSLKKQLDEGEEAMKKSILN